MALFKKKVGAPGSPLHIQNIGCFCPFLDVLNRLFEAKTGHFWSKESPPFLQKTRLSNTKRFCRPKKGSIFGPKNDFRILRSGLLNRTKTRIIDRKTCWCLFFCPKNDFRILRTSICRRKTCFFNRKSTTKPDFQAKTDGM